MPGYNSETKGSDGSRSGSTHLPNDHNKSSAAPQDAEGPLDTDFWTDENKSQWIGPDAVKQAPGLNSRSAACLRDALKKLTGRIVRNHCKHPILHNAHY